MNARGIAGIVFDWWMSRPLFLTAVGVGGGQGVLSIIVSLCGEQ